MSNDALADVISARMKETRTTHDHVNDVMMRKVLEGWMLIRDRVHGTALLLPPKNHLRKLLK